MTALSVGALSARLYPQPAQCDPVVAFVERLRRRARPEHDVLDLGAGAGERSQYALRGSVRSIVGVDLDPRVERNPLLDRGVIADLADLPFESNSFDVVFSIYVLEHIAQPTALAAAVHRVLRPGGIFMALTPNVAHYAAAASRVTPTAFHRWYNRQRGRDDADTFPTWYRLNSRAALRRHFGGAGLEPVAIDGIEVRPNYLTFSPLAFLAGAAYERVVNAYEPLSPLRVNFVAVFRKPAPAAHRSAPQS